ncbi:MAG: endonuclease/exonuclease/phosphatase family protein [Rubricoccaceae bacterium]
MRRLPLSALALLFVALFASNCAGPGTGGSAGSSTAVSEAGPTRPFQVEDPPVFRAEGFRVATFNAEFLFDGEEPEGRADFPWKGNPAASQAHREAVARVIRTLDADLVVLQEAENLRALELMIAEGLMDMGYTPHLVPGTDTFTRQNIGMLSRVPLEAQGRTDERAPVAGSSDTYGVSKNMWARFSLGGTPVTVIGVHFLAQPDNRARKPQREAQAEVIRRLVAREAAAGREVIVAGDFNDFDDEILDRRGSEPITDVLATIKRGAALRNVMAEVPRARRFTALWDRNDNNRVDEGELSAIDHILLSPGLYRRLREVHYVHAHDPRVVSDHFPIVVTLAR